MYVQRYCRLDSFVPLALAMIAMVLVFSWQNAHASRLERMFAPKAKLWSHWDASNESSAKVIDHSQWQALLQRYLKTADDQINRLDYCALKSEQSKPLKDYLLRLQRIPVKEYSRKQQLAFWINLYNAATVDLILQYYPVKSIRDIDISPGIFSDGPWGKTILTVDEQNLSLNDIEHRILRPIWKDPRIHYALNCASLGCPNLQPRAFTGDRINEQLDHAAQAFLRHPRALRIENQALHLSSIYNWFYADFGGRNETLLAHIRQYAAPSLANKLKASNFRYEFSYDWHLNDIQHPHCSESNNDTEATGMDNQ